MFKYSLKIKVFLYIKYKIQKKIFNINFSF